MMRAWFKPRLAVGAAIASMFVAPQVSAQQSTTNSVNPVLFQGTPTTADVVKTCDLPASFDPASPATVTVNQPPQNAGTTFPQNPVDFEIEVQLSSNKPPRFSFTDLSPGPSQFTDAPGVDAVVAQGSQSANIYCRLNMLSDTGMGVPGNTLTSVTFYWVLGPCGLPDEGTVDAICSAYNESGLGLITELVQGHIDTALGAEESETPINLCGCTNPARFCDPAIPAGESGSCNPSQGGILRALENTSVGTAGTNTCLLVKKGGTWVNQCF